MRDHFQRHEMETPYKKMYEMQQRQCSEENVQIKQKYLKELISEIHNNLLTYNTRKRRASKTHIKQVKGNDKDYRRYKIWKEQDNFKNL